jgi:hypothetical protein
LFEVGIYDAIGSSDPRSLWRKRRLLELVFRQFY